MNKIPSIPQDPQLEAWLDEALAPIDVPEGLNERIFSATESKVTALANRRPSVIARLNRPSLHLAAAVALLVLVAGQVFWFAEDVEQGPGLLVQNDPSEEILPLPKVDPLPEPVFAEHLDWLASVEIDAQPIDDRIDVLSMQVTLADTSGLWSESGLNSLDNAIARHEIDEISDGFDLLF